MSKPMDLNIVMEEAVRAGNMPAVVEIDHERGVVYVHDARKGITAIRICGLKTPIPKGQIDITLQTLNGSDVTDGYVINYGSEDGTEPEN